MSKEILADVACNRTRVGLLEDGHLVEYYIETDDIEKSRGNIYKGRVTNVLPGMQAAFVDIGFDKNAFLYVSDVNFNEDEFDSLKKSPIESMLKKGQEILVQVTKEAVRTKGARVSTNISLPGRYAVLLPGIDCVGVSRKIEDENERRRLKAAAEEVKPHEMGIIARTAAENKNEEEIRADVKYLEVIWSEIEKKQRNIEAPALIYKDMDLLSRVVRDMFTFEIDKFYINTQKGYEKVCKLSSAISSALKERITFYEDSRDIFEYFNATKEIEKALERKIWLKSGGYIIIDYTEALAAIDVNTGKFVGRTNLEDTIFRTNLEAAKEIVKQLRLRDIGGIIIIDFIDMQGADHKAAVIDTLKNELKKDRTKTQVFGITNLGLVEMTRKKVCRSLYEVMEATCPKCHGKGRIQLNFVDR